ncbi:type III pantothenate kinase [Litorilituus sediminis]|uniref:Type III pantothenate kinase n=1 Tax=Litorilituus sediminis TaxID=718192 RepID=A0A4P6P4X2_9GAMM|nr:type III pantothenate kinase [Litorilituus sediminis]QBG35998.1 type III pantothenate kinase [Litorilituus sediminis]
MNALIDIGNSRAKYTLYHLRQYGDIQVVANEQFDQQYFNQHFLAVEGVIVASVANELLVDALHLWCKQNNKSFKQVVSEQQKANLCSAYDKPESLGVDRWLALVAVSNIYPQQNCLIVDAGTATTIDLLTADGQHQGGYILAGIDTLYSAVLSDTTLVHAEKSTQATLAFGKNTSANVNNACWAATIGAINVAIEQAEQLAKLDKVIITGGNAHKLQQHLQLPSEHVANLIFQGLATYIE